MQSLAVSAAAILVTFAALEWRETRGREHARACRDWRSERKTRIVVTAALFTVSLTALSGCATLRSQGAVGTPELLAAAGFQRQSADSAEQTRNLASMPPLRIVARGMADRDVVYTYADPVKCRCLYVGGPKQYMEYQRLARQRQIEEDDLWVESGGMDWALWEAWPR